MTQMSICHRAVYKKERPAWPEGVPDEFRHLADRCWAHDATSRPRFDQILADLLEMRKGVGECGQFQFNQAKDGSEGLRSNQTSSSTEWQAAFANP